MEEVEEISQEQHDKELKEDIDAITSTAENLLRNIIESYKDAYNRVNEKNELDYFLTITNHKIDTPQGKKDVAYIRLERAMRDKLVQPNGEPQDWRTQLIHQEMHTFRNMQERLNPSAPWKEALFLTCIYRLAYGGIEYAELLQRVKQQDEPKKAPVVQPMPEKDLVITSEMPRPLSPAEIQYVEDIKQMRAAEGI